jgi:amylosucrase
VPFQDNPATGDCRISGTSASLTGVEQGDPLAAARVLLLHSVALSTGGIPLLYLGDEVGTPNDTRYLEDPAKAGDSRWVHRPAREPNLYAQRHKKHTVPGQIYQGLRRMIDVRASLDVFAGGQLTGFRAGSPSVLGYTRGAPGQQVLVLANFSEVPQQCPAVVFSAQPAEAMNLLSVTPRALHDGLTLAPYEVLWLDCSTS